MTVCVCVRACVRACVRVCVCVCGVAEGRFDKHAFKDYTGEVDADTWHALHPGAPPKPSLPVLEVFDQC